MNKSGLSFGDTRLIIPIFIFFFILVFLKISLDRVSQEATKQIIEAQSISIEKLLSSKQNQQVSTEDIIQIINDVSYIPVVSIKIISPNSDILFDQTYDSIDNFARLMTKSYELKTSDFTSTSILIICTYNFTKYPEKLNSKIRFIFIITIFILFLFLFIYGFIFYKKVNIQSQKKEELISKNSLINIYNNQNFNENILREATRMKRNGGTLSVICIALDDLDEQAPEKISDMKKMMYNSAIQIIIDNVRIFDMIGKFDNDNHIYICMIDATENDAYNVAKRFSQKIFDSKFYVDGHDEVTTTICAGIASLIVYKDTENQPSIITENNVTDLISHSIQAYRNASEIGRNSVVKYSTIANK